jgi:DNA invertase Pin-like site-specific DNA recombinase
MLCKNHLLGGHARLRKWNVVRVFEEKKSGASARRPQYSELLNEARKRKIDGVLVWKIDRWGRNSRDIINSLHELDGLGVSFISLQETLDFSTPHGRAMAQLIGYSRISSPKVQLSKSYYCFSIIF